MILYNIYSVPGVGLPGIAPSWNHVVSRHLSSMDDSPNAQRVRDDHVMRRCRRSPLASSVGWRLLMAAIGMAGLWGMVHWAVAVP